MLPELCTLPFGGPILYSYGTLLALAIVLGFGLALRNHVRAGYPLPRAAAVVGLGVLGGFWGARIQYFLVNPADFEGVLSILDLRGGGFFALGAVLGGVTVGTLALLPMKLPVLHFLDLMSPGLALGLAVGRLGCFLGGCDYGKVAHVPWAVRFPEGSLVYRDHLEQGRLESDAERSLPVHPTQLYEFLALLILCLVLQALVRRNRASAGATVLTFVTSYALLRILNEFLRGDAARGLYGGVSSTQWTAFGVLLIAAGMWAVRVLRRDGEPSGDVP